MEDEMEELKFLIQCCGWIVTKLYSHFTFEQDTFKKEFVYIIKKKSKMQEQIMKNIFINLWITQILEWIVEIIWIIQHLNQVNEISYYNIFDKTILNFVNSDILETKNWANVWTKTCKC